MFPNRKEKGSYLLFLILKKKDRTDIYAIKKMDLKRTELFVSIDSYTFFIRHRINSTLTKSR